MTVRLESVTFTSGDGATRVPSYLAIPDGDGRHPTVLILRGVAGPDDGYTEIARRLAEWGHVFVGPTRRMSPCTPICRGRCLSWDRSHRLISRDWPSSASVAEGYTPSWRPERTRRSA